jgi:hypothetical protein
VKQTVFQQGWPFMLLPTRLIFQVAALVDSNSSQAKTFISPRLGFEVSL